MKTVKATKVLRTGELTGAALDWAVAKCEGCSEKRLNNAGMWMHIRQQGAFRFSTEWSHGGPIIEREHLSIEATHVGGRVGGLDDRWMASDRGHCTEFAYAPLIAAMRCYVASKLGDTVEVPEELTQ